MNIGNYTKMLERKYKTHEFADGSKYLTVIFTDPKYQLITTFLFVEVNSFEDWIKEDFDDVLSGKYPFRESGGNICGLEITPETTKIYNLLVDDEDSDCCEVDTKELRAIIEEWCDKVKNL